MKAIVYHGKGDIRLDTVSDPDIEDDNDAIVRLTASAICGTDLHFIRGSFGGMKSGTILGHEGVGIVEEVGKGVRNFRKGDRVVVPSTIACGSCSYCRASYYSKCDFANPKDPMATAFFGGPEGSGGFGGMQAEFVRVPFANVGLQKLPDAVSDDDAILLSDIFPTALFGVDLASVRAGHTVGIFGCGPVGQFAIAAAKLADAGRIIAIDQDEARLEMARSQGAEAVNFAQDDPVETIREMTRGIGLDCAVDAVGIDADDKGSIPRKQWAAGRAPAQALTWAIDVLAKAGHLGVIGVYPPTFEDMPFGKAFGKNLTIRMGDCPHRRYLPGAIRAVAEGKTKPSAILTEKASFDDAIAAYEAFDRHEQGWLKVELTTPATGSDHASREDGMVTA